MGTLDYQNSADAREQSWNDWKHKIFGVSRKEIWEALAAEINARYEKGGWWKGDRVVAEIGNWQVVLDLETCDDCSYTRIRAPYCGRDQFDFCIYRKSVFSAIGKLLGMQDIEIGDPYFDEDFIIKANSVRQVRALLEDRDIRRLIQAQPKITFKARRDSLVFTAYGIIKEIDPLRDLFDLFSRTLHRLVEIGSAADSPPDLEL